MAEFPIKYYCTGCGKLLLKSAKEIKTPVEVVCSRSQCRKKQVICSDPLPYSEQVAGLSKKNNEYCAERERIKREWLLEKRTSGAMK